MNRRDDLFRQLDRRAVIGVLALEKLSIAENHRHEIVEVVSNAARKHAERIELQADDLQFARERIRQHSDPLLYL